MKAAMKQSEKHEWAKYIRFYNNQNQGRPTRLGVFERDGGVTLDYWLESGLPLAGIDIDAHADLPFIQITFAKLTHRVADAASLTFHLSASGDEDGLDILDSTGRVTVLRF